MENSIKNFALDLFFPRFCLGCKKEGNLLCQDCKSTLDIAEYNYCLCNKNPLRLAPLSQGKLQAKCSSCKDKKLSGLYFALSYKEKFLTKKIIYQFKYEPYLKELSKALSNIILEHLIITGKNRDELWQNSVLIPIPLSKKKIKSRGYNQAEELAKELAKTIKIPVLTDVLVKVKETPSQMKLSKEKRQENLKSAFILKNSEKIKNKKIFLVDDVYTTGSTMEECANVLRTSGTKQVFGIVVAREE